MNQLINLPPGQPATILTLNVMAEVSRNAAMTERMREKMIDLLQGLSPATYRDYVQDVETFCKSNVLLINEAEEVLVDPLRMLDDIDRGKAAGDCDDIAALAASLLYSAGIRTRFKAVFPHTEGFYQHVFTEYRLNDAEPWRPIDPTIDHIPVYPPSWITVEVMC